MPSNEWSKLHDLHHIDSCHDSSFEQGAWLLDRRTMFAVLMQLVPEELRDNPQMQIIIAGLMMPLEKYRDCATLWRNPQVEATISLGSNYREKLFPGRNESKAPQTMEAFWPYLWGNTLQQLSDYLTNSDFLSDGEVIQGKNGFTVDDYFCCSKVERLNLRVRCYFDANGKFYSVRAIVYFFDNDQPEYLVQHMAQIDPQVAAGFEVEQFIGCSFSSPDEERLYAIHQSLRELATLAGLEVEGHVIKVTHKMSIDPLGSNLSVVGSRDGFCRFEGLLEPGEPQKDASWLRMAIEEWSFSPDLLADCRNLAEMKDELFRYLLGRFGGNRDFLRRMPMLLADSPRFECEIDGVHGGGMPPKGAALRRYMLDFFARKGVEVDDRVLRRKGQTIRQANSHR